MPRLETTDDIEKALFRLMPVALSGPASEENDNLIDELAGDTIDRSKKTISWRFFTAVAAAITIGWFVALSGPEAGTKHVASTDSQAGKEMSEMVFLTGSDRVEDAEDEGLFVDTGGSAVRKIRFRVVEETQVRDEETGIIVMLTEPREEQYMVPVSTF